MLILASQSPRRQELLKLVGLPFEVVVSHFDEHSIKTPDLRQLPLLEATKKAEVVAKTHPNDIVLGADTGVYINNIMLGKPRNADDAKRMLLLLSGQTHEVITGVCLIKDGKKHFINSVSKVTFYELTKEEIEAYVATKEPFDKAGAYGIQGYGATLIKSIEGDYFTIMGLPIAAVYRELQKLK